MNADFKYQNIFKFFKVDFFFVIDYTFNEATGKRILLLQALGTMVLG